MRLTALLGIVALIFSADCGSGSSVTAPTLFDASSALDEILNVMQAHSIHRDEVDWTSLRSAVHAIGDGIKSEAQLDPAIREAFRLLGDNHSLYYHPNGQYVLSPLLPQCSAASVVTEPLPSNVGYVQVPGNFNGVTGVPYALSVQNSIAAADRPDLAGWIVDLRHNGGGSFYEMLAGVGPVLGNGLAGSFLKVDGTAIPFSYDGGVASANGVPEITIPPYVLMHPAPRVAVLIDNVVASSGEAVLVSFVGRPNTRLFGTATCGLSTGNTPYHLTTGATLQLCDSVDRDRN